ncbi:type II secretion system F family protein [Lachnoclostridium sp. Marseille-P6806]|uniref:type II secretion system F family protein n=1 Tax=Lachnoclostridium sp. Marseille-P6806 TaxID=2364793 RepID=UPI0013EEF4F2|nr:type II secretion system F family protein [Lachnoclostridium sp. Marseille-P6806]
MKNLVKGFGDIALYIGVLAAFLVLGMLSRRESVPAGSRLPLWQRPFARMAVWLYRRGGGSGRSRPIRREKRLCRRRFFAARLPFSSAAVRTDLQILNPAARSGCCEEEYYTQKLRVFLIMAFGAAYFALTVRLSSLRENSIRENGALPRPGYGQPGEEYLLEAQGEDGEVLGSYPVTVHARAYTAEETDAMAREILQYLAEELAGENEDLAHVSRRLFMPAALDDCPFRITWESSRYELLDADGSVHNNDIEEGQSIPVTVTVRLRLGERQYEEAFDVLVVAGVRDETEKLHAAIAGALSERDRSAPEDAMLYLPEKVEGRRLSWSVRDENPGLGLFLLMLLLAGLRFRGADTGLHRKIEQRSRQLRMDYPKLLSRLALFAGAGMSIRSAFVRIGRDYQQELERGGEKRFVYEEVLLMCRELGSGVPESECYTHFGQRCGLLQYSRFCSLLTQNLRKGNQTLLTALQNEASAAFAERRSLARQMGEEAGTKLLLPMILMLVVTMVMIVIPAYSSFAM